MWTICRAALLKNCTRIPHPRCNLCGKKSYLPNIVRTKEVSQKFSFRRRCVDPSEEEKEETITHNERKKMEDPPTLDHPDEATAATTTSVNDNNDDDEDGMVEAEPTVVHECDELAEYTKFIGQFLGKPGPMYLNVGIMEHNFMDWLDDETKQQLEEKGTTDVFPIGEAGREVTLRDIEVAWRRASKDTMLYKLRYESGRSCFREGFYLSEDGKTLHLGWGS